MIKYIIITSIFIYHSLSYSQGMDRIRVDAHKLKFNTSLSTISSDYVDGKLLFFQNKKAVKKHSQYYDLFILDSANLYNENGNKEKISLTKQLMTLTDYHEGPCFVDDKNNKIYITINSLDKKEVKREKKLNGLDKNRLSLLEGDFKDGVISNVKEFTHNSIIYNIGHATYSESTKRLYFSSTMPGSVGGSDIFYCTKKMNGSWDTPINIGTRVNSIKSELFPYVKNGILFFSSNGQKKQVGTDLDLFFIKESELMTKSPTELTGTNTNFDDYAICFNDNEAEFEGFFTSNRNNKFPGDDDIYEFTISNVNYEKNYDLLVKFSSNGEYLTQGNLALLDEEGNKIKTIEGNKGEFNFGKLEKAKQYKLVYNNEDFSKLFELPINYYNSFQFETFDIGTDTLLKDTLITNDTTVLVNKLGSTDQSVSSVNTFTEIKISDTLLENILATDVIAVLMNKLDSTVKITNKVDTFTEIIKFDRKEFFENIYFAFDSYMIYEYSQNKIDKLIKLVNTSNVKYIILNAYADARGSTEYNYNLSIKRALSVREYLIENGIPESKIKYKGFGESNLVNDCGNGVKCNEKAHKKNRRIEFEIAY